MNDARFHVWPTVALLLALVASSAPAQDDKVHLEPREKWTTLTAGSKAEFHFALTVPAGFKGRAAWSFADQGTKSVFARGRGEAAIAADPKMPATIKIALDVPPLNDGVALLAQLLVVVYADGKAEPEATHDGRLWIFADDPFFGRAKWLEGLKITLFEPDAKSKTAEALRGLKSLKELKSPFEEVHNSAALADVKEGVVLVAEGVSLKDDPGLAEMLVKLAARGVPVLCLAPKDGKCPLPGADNGLPSPSSVDWRRQDFIEKLDKRLDSIAWPPDNRLLSQSLAIQADDGKVDAAVIEGSKGWPVLQADFADMKSRLVLVSFPIIQNWDNGPTPRYLLASLLEHVAELNKNGKAEK